MPGTRVTKTNNNKKIHSFKQYITCRGIMDDSIFNFCYCFCCLFYLWSQVQRVELIILSSWHIIIKDLCKAPLLFHLFFNFSLYPYYIKVPHPEHRQPLKFVLYIFLCTCFYKYVLSCEHVFLIHINGIVISLFLSQCFYDPSMLLCVTTNGLLLIVV